MPSLSDIFSGVDAFLEPWLGYNWIVFSPRDPVMSAAGISSLELPEANIIYHRQQGLSTRVQHIPASISYSDLVIRAPVVRANSVLSSKLDRILDYFGGRTNLTEIAASALLGIEPLDVVYDSLTIVGFNGGAALGKTPIGVWQCNNLLISAYRVEGVNVNEAKLVHEEIAFKVASFKRIL